MEKLSWSFKGKNVKKYEIAFHKVALLYTKDTVINGTASTVHQRYHCQRKSYGPGK